MVDLLQSQIQESCRLALPEGLKDLMCDISREVLRAQPTNLFKFIADYLSALLVTRENLSIASRICDEVCSCQPELENELRNIGINDEDVPVVTEIVLDHFYNGKVHEANVMMKILKCTEIAEDQLLDVQKAIRNAFMKHRANHTTTYESSSDSEKDEVADAVRHTLTVYKKTKPSNEECQTMAKKIQASYRAYGVKKYCQAKRPAVKEGKATEKNVKLMLPENSSFQKAVTEGEDSQIRAKKKLYTVSSTSLAGSYMKLPKYVPYSAHETELLSDLEETSEKEHAHIDYTAANPHVSISNDTPIYRQKKISFEVKDDDSIPESIREEIHDDIDDELKEHINEEIVIADHGIEDSDASDDNVVTIDLHVDTHGNEIYADDEKFVKPDDHNTKDNDFECGSGHAIADDVAEYVMNEEFSREFEEDDSGHAL